MCFVRRVTGGDGLRPAGSTGVVMLMRSATRVLTYVPIVGIKHGHLQTLFSDLLMNTPTTLPGCAGRVGQRGEAKLWE